MEPAVTRPRTLAFIAAVCWWIAALPLGPGIGKLLVHPRISTVILAAWVVCASLSAAVLIIEVLRAIISHWSTWTNARHFYVVLAVAGTFALLQYLALVFGLSRGYA
jgi:hypothetical protein